jgi:hypothetical protein
MGLVSELHRVSDAGVGHCFVEVGSNCAGTGVGLVPGGDEDDPRGSRGGDLAIGPI